MRRNQHRGGGKKHPDNPRAAVGRWMIDEQEKAAARLALARLRQEHTDFDAAINAMEAVGCDKLQVQRMKKKKLAIKDMIARLSAEVLPDIIA
jgi:hypothetical protein